MKSRERLSSRNYTFIYILDTTEKSIKLRGEGGGGGGAATPTPLNTGPRGWPPFGQLTLAARISDFISSYFVVDMQCDSG